MVSGGATKKERLRKRASSLEECALTFMGGKVRPTAKFESQLASTEMDMAVGRVPWVNSSAVIMNGIEPGPIPKKSVKVRMLRTLIHFIQSNCA